MTEYRVSTVSVAETEKLAEQIGGELRGGEVIELIGDVGSGKTAFTRGLAKGIGSKDRVSSPTFTINNVYSSSGLRLYHYDFYRLDDFLIIKNELKEVISDPKNSVVLEWAEEIKNALPKDHIKISIQTQSEHERKFKISIPEKFSYIEVQK